MSLRNQYAFPSRHMDKSLRLVQTRLTPLLRLQKRSLEKPELERLVQKWTTQSEPVHDGDESLIGHGTTLCCQTNPWRPQSGTQSETLPNTEQTTSRILHPNAGTITYLGHPDFPKMLSKHPIVQRHKLFRAGCLVFNIHSHPRNQTRWD